MNNFFYYCQKTFDIEVALCKPENALHARTSQVTTKMGSAHTSQLATAHGNLQRYDETSQVMFCWYSITVYRSQNW